MTVDRLLPIIVAVLVTAALTFMIATGGHRAAAGAPPCSIDGNFANDAPGCISPRR